MKQKALKKEATILFCDIRNFTNLFDERDPIEAVDFANSVLAVLGEDVEKNGGEVDRFTGDGFLAHFGIKEEKQDHVQMACKAVISLRKVLEKINKQRYFETESVVSFGIGLHTGTVGYGKIETPRFRQYTVLGDVVNTASRIEQLTKFFTVDILVSNPVYTKMQDRYDFKKMPPHNVNGKQQDVSTYWLLPTNF